MKSIKIGAIEYDIYEIADLRSSDDEKLNGHIKYEDMEIKINEHLEQPQKAIALLHEILHGIAHLTGRGHNERKIDSMAQNLYQVLRDNWDVIGEYILSKEN